MSKTTPKTTGTVQTAPAGQGPTTSSADPLVQKRLDDQQAKDEYKAHKADAKADYKDQMKAAKSAQKAEKARASAKRRADMAKQGGPAQTPGSGGE